jgi:hypothetical protein
MSTQATQGSHQEKASMSLVRGRKSRGRRASRRSPHTSGVKRLSTSVKSSAILQFLNLHPPPDIYEDNLDCVAMSENPVRRKFSSHIDICRYFVRELVGNKTLCLIPLRTHLIIIRVADALTRPRVCLLLPTSSITMSYAWPCPFCGALSS